MKKIECIIREDRVKELREALRLKGVGGMTLTHVQGFGRETTRPANYLLLPKIKVEIYCTSEQLEEYINTIINICRTGELGDGKIAVIDLENIVRIRTAEEKEAAIL